MTGSDTQYAPCRNSYLEPLANIEPLANFNVPLTSAKESLLLKGNPRKSSCHLLRQPKALHLKDFLEHFKFTRRVTTNKSKITSKTLNLQHFRLFRNDGNCVFQDNMATIY